MQNGGFPVL